jgi:hypothetical protein
MHPAFPSDGGFCDDCSNSYQVNPASGLPMISGNTSGVDVAGNPFGFSNDHFGSATDSAMSSSPHIGAMGIGCD